MEYTKCLVELDEILNYLSLENLEKIPLEIRNSIKEHKDKEYIWKYDETKELNEQELDRKTIAMLSYLNMEYLLNEEQKEFMQNLHKLNEQKLEKEKQKKYNSSDLFKNTSNNRNLQKEVALIKVKKEKLHKRIIAFLRSIFR